jgi:hypothetical protein
MESNIPRKVKTARFVFWIMGGLGIIAAAFFLGLFLFASMKAGLSREELSLLDHPVLGDLGILLAVLSAAVGVGAMIVAGGISRRKAWSRIAGIILGVIILPALPVGTVFGAFILAGLFGREASAWYAPAA